MATRSTIALEFADGTVGQVYCHWDGYLDYNGRLLLEHWSDPFKLRELIDLGALSSLSREIGEKHQFDNPGKYGTPEYDAYRQLIEHMCTFYARDRGEELSTHSFKSYKDYLDNAQFEEYNYILRPVDNRPVWFVSSYMTDNRFVRLEYAMEVEANDKEMSE